MISFMMVIRRLFGIGLIGGWLRVCGGGAVSSHSNMLLFKESASDSTCSLDSKQLSTFGYLSPYSNSPAILLSDGHGVFKALSFWGIC